MILERRNSGSTLERRNSGSASGARAIHVPRAAAYVGSETAQMAVAHGTLILLWEVSSTSTSPPRELAQGGRVTALALSSDGGTLACSIEASKASTGSQLEAIGRLCVLDVATGA